MRSSGTFHTPIPFAENPARRWNRIAATRRSRRRSRKDGAAAAGYVDERAIVLETLTAIRRAGADIVITYHAKDAARWLQT